MTKLCKYCSHMAVASALLGFASAGHAQNYFQASLSAAVGQGYETVATYIAGVNICTYQSSTGSGPPGFLFGTPFPLLMKNGYWLPAATSEADLDYLDQYNIYYSWTLSTEGIATQVTTVKGIPSNPYYDDNNLISQVETYVIDLNTGKYQYSLTATPICNNGLGGTSLITAAAYDGSVSVNLTPASAPNFTLYFANPFANYTYTGPNPASVDESLVLSSPPASALAADGVSAAVVVVQSTSSAPISLSLAAPSYTGIGSIGTLAPYTSSFLNYPAPNGTTALSPIEPTDTSCESDGNMCTFLALLWAPATLPVNQANLTAGSFVSLPLNVTATQGSNSATFSIMLQPPPLLLVHGLWSSAAQAWGGPSGFLQWLGANYPSNLIRAVNYQPYNSEAFNSSDIQNVFLGTSTSALSDAADQGVAARTVDVVGHSMGGLVARCFLNKVTCVGPPALPAFFASNAIHNLVTIGTPHQGSQLAAELEANASTVASSSAVIIPAYCRLKSIVPCTMGGVFGSQGHTIGSAIQSMEPGSSQLLSLSPSDVFSAIVGVKPAATTTCPSLPFCAEGALDLLIGTFLPGQTDESVLGDESDTIVSVSSQNNDQNSDVLQMATIANVVHTVVFPGDIAETASSCTWSQTVFWLMGGSGLTPFGCSSSNSSSPSVLAHQFDETTSGAPSTLDLTGYAQVPASNVSFSPATGSNLTIGSQTTITATSSTKTISEVLLFQTVSDPTDVPMFYSTQSPFSITFTPTRMGSGNFVAFAVFSDMTFATTTLQYTFQPSGSPMSLALVNAPSGNLPVGSIAVVNAQAGFSSGPIDVTQLAAYSARSGSSAVFSLASGGVITATGPGVDWLDVSYGGFTASAQVTVGSCTYALSPVSQIVDASGGSLNVQVTTGTGCAWVADDGGAAWLTASSAGGTGSGTITYTASANSSGATQTAFVTVAGQDVAIVQPATECVYTLSATQISLTASGGSGTITVTTACPITASSNAGWLVPVVVGDSVEYTAAANTGITEQSATLTIGESKVEVTEAGAVIPIATFTPSSVNFGGQNVGVSSAPFVVTLSNTGNAGLTISSIAITGANSGDFSVAGGTTCLISTSLAPSASCILDVTFTPSLDGTESAALSVGDNANGSPQTISLSGTGAGEPLVNLSPSSLTFPPQVSGTTSTAQTVTLTNAGNGSLAILSISTGGAFYQTNTCRGVLAAGDACSISVTFQPLGPGVSNGTLTIFDSASGSPQTVTLTGTGLVFTSGPNPPVVQPPPTNPEPGQAAPPSGASSPIGVGLGRPVHSPMSAASSLSASATIAPGARFSSSSVVFTAQMVGTSSSAQRVILTNSGDAPMPISNITASGDFSQTNDCGSTLEAGAHCTFSVTFKPAGPGMKAGTLTVSEDPARSPRTLTLKGKGVVSTIGGVPGMTEVRDN